MKDFYDFMHKAVGDLGDLNKFYKAGEQSQNDTTMSLIGELDQIIDYANIGQNLVLQKKLQDFRRKLINQIEVNDVY